MKYKEDFTWLDASLYVLGTLFLIAGSFNGNFHEIVGGFLLMISIEPINIVHYQGR